MTGLLEQWCDITRSEFLKGLPCSLVDGLWTGGGVIIDAGDGLSAAAVSNDIGPAFCSCCGTEERPGGASTEKRSR
jgi:hypothetical protein